jgi:phosphoserine phosphatase
LPWFDPEIVLDVALGGALLALREKFPEPIPELREEAEKALDEVLAHGVRFAVSSATQSVLSSNKKFILLFSNGNRPNKKNQ